MSATEKKAGPGALRAAPPPVRRINWPLVLAWFMRLLALGWIIKGLASWAAILGVEYFEFRPFETRAATFQAITIYFAVIDLIAAVGLWLLSPWGSVVWLIAATSRIVLGFVFPAAAAAPLMASTSIGVCILLMLLLSWLASRQRDE